MSFYSDLALDVNALLKEFGQTITLVQRGPGTYDPAAGSATPVESTATPYAAIFDYEARMIDGVLIQQGDLRMLLSASALSFTPEAGAKVTLADGRIKTLVGVQVLSPAGTKVMYEGTLR